MKMIGIVGLGFMGGALARAIRTRHPDLSIGIVEKDEEKRRHGMEELNGLDYSDDPGALVRRADVVILAIKPQDLEAFGVAVRHASAANDSSTEGDAPAEAVVISVLAGTPTQQVAAALGTTKVTRIMPNLAADIGRAVIGVTHAPTLDEPTRAAVTDLLAGAGTVVEIPERLMAAITAVSGSGIAFAFDFIHALAAGGVEQGLPYAQALSASIDVVSSAAELLRRNAVHPQEMVSRVSSPGGTTIAGMRALADGAFQAVVMDAVQRAAERSRELEG